VNDVEKQNASYKQMYFKIPRIIATGTPEFLKHGDVIETEITGVGVMRNTIRAEG
jgi:2-keto-4-pentenoate hydratase/2-oxohepta-3-ene-1,7-dioic acid hydratase in catechol pathway